MKMRNAKTEFLQYKNKTKSFAQLFFMNKSSLFLSVLKTESLLSLNFPFEYLFNFPFTSRNP